MQVTEQKGCVQTLDATMNIKILKKKMTTIDTKVEVPTIEIWIFLMMIAIID